MKTSNSKRTPAVNLLRALLIASTSLFPRSLRAAGIQEATTAPSVGDAKAAAIIGVIPMIEALDIKPWLHGNTAVLALRDEPLATRPLAAQLMAMNLHAAAVLEHLKESKEPANVALYGILSHPDVISEQRQVLAPIIGGANFKKLLKIAKYLNGEAERVSSVREALSDADAVAALDHFKSSFDGAGKAAGLPAARASENVSRIVPNGLRKPEPVGAAPGGADAIAGGPFQYIEKDGKKFLELRIGNKVRTMELGLGGPRAPQVKFLSADLLEVSAGGKPFKFKLTEDNLQNMAIMMELLSDPELELTNLMLRGDMGAGKNTLVYTLAGLLHQGVRVMSFHAHTTENDLRYRTTLVNGETKRMLAEIYAGMEAGDWTIADEPNKPLQIGILNSLNTLLQQRQEVMGGDKRRIVADARGRVISLINPTGSIYAVQDMPGDFVRRFSVLDINYMKPADEEDYIMGTVFFGETEKKKEQIRPLIKQLVLLADDIRSSYKQSELPRPLSTRAVMSMAWHIKKFPKDLPYFREIFDPVYVTEYMEPREKELVERYLDDHGFKGVERPSDFELPDVEIDEKAGVVRLGDEKTGVVELPLGDLKADEIPKSYKDIPHLQGNLRLWWAMMKDRALGQHTLLLGETGTGKTQLTGHYLYALLRLRPEEQTFTPETRGQDILGKPDLKNDSTHWPAYPLERAIKRDTIWAVDEVTKPKDPGTASVLNNVMQFGEVTLPSGEVLKTGSGFGIVAMGTPGLAQYEAQEFSGEVIDRFRAHIVRPLAAKDEVGLVESFLRKQGLHVERPVLEAMQKTLESLRKAYRQGVLPVPPSVQVLYRVVSRLARFPDTKDDIVRTFLMAFPAWEKSHENVIRAAVAPVEEALGLSPAAPPQQGSSTAPKGTAPGEIPGAVPSPVADFKGFHVFDDGAENLKIDGVPYRVRASVVKKSTFVIRFTNESDKDRIRRLLHRFDFNDADFFPDQTVLVNAPDQTVLVNDHMNAQDAVRKAFLLSEAVGNSANIYMPRSWAALLPEASVRITDEAMKKIRLVPDLAVRILAISTLPSVHPLRQQYVANGSGGGFGAFIVGGLTSEDAYVNAASELAENDGVSEVRVNQEVYDRIRAARASQPTVPARVLELAKISELEPSDPATAAIEEWQDWRKDTTLLERTIRLSPKPSAESMLDESASDAGQKEVSSMIQNLVALGALRSMHSMASPSSSLPYANDKVVAASDLRGAAHAAEAFAKKDYLADVRVHRNVLRQIEEENPATWPLSRALRAKNSAP